MKSRRSKKPWKLAPSSRRYLGYVKVIKLVTMVFPSLHPPDLHFEDVLACACLHHMERIVQSRLRIQVSSIRGPTDSVVAERRPRGTVGRDRQRVQCSCSSSSRYSNRSAAAVNLRSIMLSRETYTVERVVLADTEHRAVRTLPFSVVREPKSSTE